MSEEKLAEQPIDELIALLLQQQNGFSWPILQEIFIKPRVFLILQAIKANPSANAEAARILQLELEKTTTRNQLWVYYSGWMKGHILSCFDPRGLPGDFNTLLHERRHLLTELLKLPLIGSRN